MRNLKKLPFFRAFGIIAEFEARALGFSKLELATQIFVSPAVYLLLLGAGVASIVEGRTGDVGIGSSMYLKYVVPGILVFHAINFFHKMMWRLYVDRRWGLMALKLVYGVPGIAYILGVLVVPPVFFLAQMFVVLVASQLLGVAFTVTEVVWMATGGVLAALFWGCLGSMFVFLIKNQETRNAVTTLLFLPLGFAAPTFYPLEQMPEYMRLISYFNPLTYQVDLMRVGEVFGLPNALGISVLLTLTGFCLLAALVARSEPLPSEF